MDGFDSYDEDRIVSMDEQHSDDWQYSLRPRKFGEYIGQEKVKANLSIFIQAALSRGEALDHVLLYGPPGLGKTTLAGIIANELGVNFRQTSGPAIERSGDLAALLTNLQEHDVLFIDEIHRLSHSVEEVLYSAMEDFALDIIIGKGPSANSIRLDLPRFTLIGATTPLQFADGTVVIQDILDGMMPQMISLGLTGLMYWLIKKNVNTGWLLVIAIVGGIALSAVGILA